MVKNDTFELPLYKCYGTFTEAIVAAHVFWMVNNKVIYNIVHPSSIKNTILSEMDMLYEKKDGIGWFR